MAPTVICETCAQPMGNPACPACRRHNGGEQQLGRVDVSERRDPGRQRPLPGGQRQTDPPFPADPPLTTRECADWMGVTTEFIRGAIEEGQLVAERLPGGGFRIYYDEFVTYLQRIGWRRIPLRRA